MTVTQPQAYKFCEAHFKAKCPICMPGQAQPNPVNDEPVQKVNKGVFETTDVPITQQGVPSEPVLTDPTAQKIVEAAHSYARAKEAVKLITEQRDGARELLAALQKKLEETMAIADVAQNELREATVKNA